jgi:rubrerythrin
MGAAGGDWALSGIAVEELFEMAAALEQGGFDFYARLTARAANPQVRSELKFLRDEEAAHKGFFLDRLRERGRRPTGNLGPDLRRRLEGEFLGPTARLFDSVDASDAGRVLAFGVALEEMTIQFYAAMRDGGAAPELAADLERIMGEEAGHKRRLEILTAF